MRKKNYFAGPSVLPKKVLKEIEKEIYDYQGNGISMIETSHRGPMFDKVYNEALSLFRELLGISDDYSVFFLSGGATLQFAMIPMNFLTKSADYCKSGTWSNKATSDAQKLGKVNVFYDGVDNNYTSLPRLEDIKISKDASYVYLCSNETIGGVQWKNFPNTKDIPLIADMSSDIFSREIDVNRFAMIYGGVQKNLAPAGATFVILRKDMLERANKNLPAYLDYSNHIKADGLYNTPSVFSIWVASLSLKWIKENGGVKGMQERAQLKSSMLYNAIDNSDGYYRSPVDLNYRSTMNVPFRLKSEELEKKFLVEASENGMLGLKGHRSVGGIRSSIYNALEVEDVKFLIDFMDDFKKKN